jgi:hypothetical protein
MNPLSPIGSWKTAWKNARKTAKVTCRFHDLRHSAVTRLLEAGVSFPIVASLLGWSPTTTTKMAKRYGHIGSGSPRRCGSARSADEFKEEGHRRGHSGRYRPTHACCKCLKRNGAPCKTRTCDLLVRSQTLYPTELRARRNSDYINETGPATTDPCRPPGYFASTNSRAIPAPRSAIPGSPIGRCPLIDASPVSACTADRSARS